jgi:tellurite resistance protein
VPVIGILLIAYYANRLGGAASWLCYAAVALLAINAAALFAHWLKAPFDQNALHPGYFLPVVAGPFIAGVGLMSVGDRTAAIGIFGVGIYFWVLLGAVITARLFFGSPLPQPFRPWRAMEPSGLNEGPSSPAPGNHPVVRGNWTGPDAGPAGR